MCFGKRKKNHATAWQLSKSRYHYFEYIIFFIPNMRYYDTSAQKRSAKSKMFFPPIYGQIVAFVKEIIIYLQQFLVTYCFSSPTLLFD